MLQNAFQEEKKTEVAQTNQLSKRWEEHNSFQVGDRIVEVLTKIQGTVVAIKGEKVFFSCREFGRVWRERELILKIV